MIKKMRHKAHSSQESVRKQINSYQPKQKEKQNDKEQSNSKIKKEMITSGGEQSAYQSRWPDRYQIRRFYFELGQRLG